jgi:hypothetical protein
MTTPPDRTLPLPPEHDALRAAGWDHVAGMLAHIYTAPSAVTISAIYRPAETRPWGVQVWIGDGCVSSHTLPTHAAAMQALRDVAAAFLALPEVAP